MKFKLRPYQQEASDKAVEFFNDNDQRNGIIIAPTGCHEKGYQIMMADGSLKKVEEIQVGDFVMGDDSTPRKVLRLHRGDDDMYRVIPTKGVPFVVNGGHILRLKRTNDGVVSKPYAEISVRDYLTQSKCFKHVHKLYRPEKVIFPSEGGKMVEPYFIGLFLGDGSSVSGYNITTMREEVASFLYEFADKYNLQIRDYVKPNNKAHTYFLHVNKGQHNHLKDFLMKWELFESRSGDKHIPYEYLTASYSDRLQLLAGFVDTDSHYSLERNTIEYCSKSIRMARGVEFLCRSVGLMCNIGKTKYVNGVPYYRMCISGDLDIIPNRVGIRKGLKRGQKKSPYVTGFKIEPVGKGEYYGFELDGNHLYLDWQFFVHHNSGKSLIIADIANRLDEPLLVLQPSKEILEQNYEKMSSYGIDAGIFSASVGKKEIKAITLATIGSIFRCAELFDEFEYIMIDECHLVNPEEGMYKTFFSHCKRKILGLTATPYRLNTLRIKRKAPEGSRFKYDYENRGMLEFLTTMKGKLFQRVVHHIEIQPLVKQGFLCKPRYFNMRVMDNSLLKPNTKGTNYSDESMRASIQFFNFKDAMINIIERLQHPKSGKKRNGILVFAPFIEDCEYVCRLLPNCAYVCGDTPKKERERILKEFKEGKIEVVLNVGTLIAGFDYPALDTVVLAKPTMSLSRYYQEIGRVVRPYEGKEAWVVDMVSNYDRFGAVEDLFFYAPDGKPMVCGKIDGKNKKLTNRPL